MEIYSFQPPILVSRSALIRTRTMMETLADPWTGHFALLGRLCWRSHLLHLEHPHPAWLFHHSRHPRRSNSSRDFRETPLGRRRHPCRVGLLDCVLLRLLRSPPVSVSFPIIEISDLTRWTATSDMHG